MTETIERWGWQGSAHMTLRHAGSGLVVAERDVRNTIADKGRSLLRDALGGFAADVAIHRIALGSGLGRLTVALVSGTAYTTLTVSALAQAIGNGQSLTLISPTSSQVVTASAAAAQGATSVSVTSFNANANYSVATYPSAGGTLLTSTPAAGQVALDSEQYRRQPTNVTQASATSLLTTVYVDPSQGNGFLLGEVGWFASPSATDTAGSGIMVARLLYCVTNKTNLLSMQIDRTDQW